MNADSERVWKREHVHKFGPELQRVAYRKLLILDAAETTNNLRIPPGNRLEQLREDCLERLRGNRQGQHSIRIIDQWHNCFTRTHAGPERVEITDYH